MITVKYLTNEEFEENFQKFYDNWDVTYEGFCDTKENLEYLEEEILKDYLKTNSLEASVIKGKMLNDKLSLTGDNAYPEDLNILIIPQSQLNNVERFAIKERMEYGFRWFTDVIDNNRRRG